MSRRVLFLGCILWVSHLFGDEALYRNPNASPDARAADVIARLTLDEKLTLTGGVNAFSFPPVERLGLREIVSADASQGVRLTRRQWAKYLSGKGELTLIGGGRLKSVSFPGVLALAGTWDPALAEEFGRAVGEQCRALGVDVLLGPGINMYRTSAGGRAYEYMGEDPLLTSRMVVAYVKGLQSCGVVATAKHFVCNDTEFCRHFASYDVDERTLREIYLPPWKAAIQEAGLGAIMTGNHQVNGIPACMNKPLLNDLLRTEYGYRGISMSDWQGLTYFAERAHLASTSGHSLYMPNSAVFQQYIRRHLETSPERTAEVERELDRMICCNLRTFFAAGLYDRERDRPQVKEALFEKHRKVARRTAAEAICLLKNEDRILPLDRDAQILFIGDEEVHTGKGSGHVVGYDHKPFAESLKETFGAAVTCVLPQEADDARIRAAEVVLCSVSKESGEGQDIPFELSDDRRALIERIASLNENTVLIVSACNGFDMPWLPKVKAVLWCYFLGQERGAALADVVSGAVNPSGRLPFSIEKEFKDSVDPEYNFIGGKPYWDGHHEYKSYWIRGEAPEDPSPELKRLMAHVKPKEPVHVPYREGIFMGYRWFDRKGIAPQFPFGHGLSYTDFAYQSLTLNGSDAGGSPVAQVTLKNTGSKTGTEVVQVYVSDLESRVEQAVKELAGFARIELQPGETGTVTIPLDKNAFRFYDAEKKQWVLEPGRFEVKAGSSSADLPLIKSIEL